MKGAGVAVMKLRVGAEWMTMNVGMLLTDFVTVVKRRVLVVNDGGRAATVLPPDTDW